MIPVFRESRLVVFHCHTNTPTIDKGAEAFAEAHADIGNVSEALAGANQWFDQALAVAPHLTEAHLKRADLNGHLLFEIAAGFRTEAYPGEGAAVIDALLEDYARAWNSAPPGQDRAIVEVERTLFTDDWSGLAAKLDLALTGDECAAGNWIGQLGDAYGRAARMVEWTRNSLRCDPLSGVATLSLIQALIWDGQAEDALRTLDEAETQQRTRNIPFLRDLRIASLLAADRYQDDPQAYLHGGHASLYPFPDQFLLEAVAGDPERAREVATGYLARLGVDDYSSLVAAAVVGDRAAANAAAGRIDQRPGGPFMLMEAVQMCMCGAPFELDATPLFKARIEESGFPWPPSRPIDYPLKTW